MSNVVVYLADWRRGASPSVPLEHPSGVSMPFDASVVTQKVHAEIRSGAYGADLVRRLPDTVVPGDRVLVIGGGLGVVSTLVAGVEGVERIIAVEPNAALVGYMDRVHDLNGASEVETINGLLVVGKRGMIPFLAERDPRTWSPVPCEQAMMVPMIDLNLILTEERISLIICDTPTAPAQLLAQANLERVDRILLNHGHEANQNWDGEGVCTHLIARGYSPEPSGTAVLLRKSIVRRGDSVRVAASGELSTAPGFANIG